MSFRRPRFPHQSAYLGHVSELTGNGSVSGNGSGEFSIEFEKKVVSQNPPPPKPERDQSYNLQRDIDIVRRHESNYQVKSPNLSQRAATVAKGEEPNDIEMTGYGFLGSERGVDVGLGLDLDLNLELDVDADADFKRRREERYRNNNYDEIDYSQSQSPRRRKNDQDANGNGNGADEDERGISPDLPRYRDGDTPGSFERIDINCATLAGITEENSNSNNAAGIGTGTGGFQEDDHDEHFKWWEIPIYTLLILGFVVLSCFFGVWMNGRLPSIKSNSGSFNEKRALVDLSTLTKDGPRPFGSPEHEKTPLRIMQILKQIKEHMTEMNNNNNNSDVNLAWVLDFKIDSTSILSEDPKTKSSDSTETSKNNWIIYRNVKNVVVRLDPRDPATRSNQSILINCHYDSALGSPGAGDDMASCSVMLEIIRVISQETETLSSGRGNDMKNSFVFLFNAEGTANFLGLTTFLRETKTSIKNQGQIHGQNWAKDVKVFLNLQGFGNGRSLLMRASEQSCQLVDIYTKVAPHPNSLVLAEVLFNSPVLPLNTEFSGFENMKRAAPGTGIQEIQGLELVFYQNGWKHGTKLDNPLVFLQAPGSLTHMGENALALLKNLAPLGIGPDEESANENNTKVNLNFNVKGHDAWTCFGDSTTVIYFDVFGLFQISYGTKMAFILHLIIGIVFMAIYILEGCVKGFPSLEQVCISLFFVPMAVLTMGFFVGLSFNLLDFYKPWFSHTSLVFILYGPPAILTHLLVLSCIRIHIFGKTRGGWSRLRFPLTVSWLSGKLPVVFLLFLGLFWTTGIRLGFPMMIILIFPLFSCGLNRILFCKVPAVYRCRIERMMNLFFGELPPFFYLCYLSVVIVEMILPMSGRISEHIDWNILMGLLVSIICFFLFQGLAPFLHFFTIWTKKSRFVLAALLFLNVVVVNPILIRCLLPSGQIVYGEETPMTLEIQNVNRALYHFHSNGNSHRSYEKRMIKNSSGFALTSPDSRAVHFLDQMKLWNGQLENSSSQPELDYDLEIQNETPKIIKWFPREIHNSEPHEIVTMTTTGGTQNRNSRNLTFTFEVWPKMDMTFLIGKDWKLREWNYKSNTTFTKNLELSPSTEKSNQNSSSSSSYSVKIRNSHEFTGNKFSISILLQPDSRSSSESWIKRVGLPEPGDINWDEEEESFMIQLAIKAVDTNTNAKKSPELNSFLQNFPKWTNIQSMNQVVQKYIVF